MKIPGRSLKHRRRNALKTTGATTDGLTEEEKMAERMSDKEKGGSFVRSE